MSDYDIHSCGYYCDRHACIVAQRNELRDKLFEIHTSEKSIQTSDTKPAESTRAWVGLTDDEMADFVLFHAVVDEECIRAVEAKLKEKNA